MSELVTTCNVERGFRRQLLAGVSVTALLVACLADAKADEAADRPTVWIEVGGQLERSSEDQLPLSAPFLEVSPPPAIFEASSPISLQNERPRFSYGVEGKLSFFPQGSDWVLSAWLRYGRSNGNKTSYAKSSVYHRSKYFRGNHSEQDVGLVNFENTVTKNQESHILLDFQVGKDVGVGMFGGHGTSIVSLGVRFAQFGGSSDITVRARPDLRYHDILRSHPSRVPPRFITPAKYVPGFNYHNFSLLGHSSRSVRALGPSISWNGSMPIAGNVDRAQLMFDWGANGAVLFGRQKINNERLITGRYETIASALRPSATQYKFEITNYTHSIQMKRRRSVVIPNFGGLAGLSFRFPNAKLSLGYRADFFLGAMDGGNETGKSYDRIFHGPYATISIGLGD